MLAPTERDKRHKAGVDAFYSGMFGAPAVYNASAAPGASCAYEYELQQYSGYAHDARVGQARTRWAVHDAFCTDFEYTAVTLTPEQMYRVPTLWQCLKNALKTPEV
jgi:hypothetical protein